MIFPTGTVGRDRHTPYATYILIAINIVVFLWEMLYLQFEGQAAFEIVLVQLAFNVCEIGSRSVPHMGLDMLRSTFLHGSLLHIAGNMAFLWVFGRKVESYFGPIRYILFYLLAGYAAMFGHIFFGNTLCTPGDPYGIVIGASGAVAGVMGAFLFAFPGVQVKTAVILAPFLSWRVRIPAIFYLVYWFMMDLLQGLGWFAEEGSNVAHWAHIAGFVFGLVAIFVATLLWKPAPETDPFAYLDE